MLIKTHLAIAMFILYFLFSFIPGIILEKLIFSLFFVIATFIVDIDSKKSKAGNHWYLRPFQWIFSHRGIIHSVFVGFVLSLCIFMLNNSAGIGFFFGWCIHLFLDCFTIQGTAVFWPLFNFKLKIFGIRSGGIIEQILFVLFLLADIFLIAKLII